MAKPGETTQSFFEALYAGRDADAHEITKGVHLGAFAAANDKGVMQKRKITHVLIVHPALPEKHPKVFQYGRAPLLDQPNANLLELLPDALGFLSEARSAGSGVFVCCAKGISRSSSIVVALLMFERGIGFDEAWSICEAKRPIVYPNVGFQLQLRHLEKLMKELPDVSAGWAKRLKALKGLVPRGDLENPTGLPGTTVEAVALPIRELIGTSVGRVLEDVEALADKVLCQPQLLQKRELWKRHGLFFENLHKYKAMPADEAVLEPASRASTTLQSLPKVFSDTLKGIKLALAVAKELDAWVATVRRLLANPSEVPNPVVPAHLIAPPANADKGADKAAAAPAGQEDEKVPEVPDWVTQMIGKGREEAMSKKEKKEQKKKEKKDKKEKKAQEKEAKAAKKAAKLEEKLERAARKAEQQAEFLRQETETAAERAQRAARELKEMEAEEEFEARAAAAAKRGGQPGKRSPPSPEPKGRGFCESDSSSDSPASSEKKKRRR